MYRIMTCVVAMGLIVANFAAAHDGKQNSGGSPSVVTVNGSGNGAGNKTEVDPSAGQKVVVNGSANGTGNTLTVAPDPKGKVVINASGNGTGNKIVVEEAPGEKVVVRGSGNGKNNNVIIEKVPGPTTTKPAANTSTKSGGQSHKRH